MSIFVATRSNIFRWDTQGSKNLKDSLSDRSRRRRKRQYNVSVKVTFMFWLVETIGCLCIVVGTLIIGKKNIILTSIMQSITYLSFAVLVPLTYLLSFSDIKEKITDADWSTALRDFFTRNLYTNKTRNQ